MKPLDWPLLADENIHPDVIQGLLSRGKDVRSVRQTSPGIDDREVLRIAHSENRVVLTHDADFGRLVVLEGEPFTGIIYLRPVTSRPHSSSESSTRWRRAHSMCTRPSFSSQSAEAIRFSYGSAT